MATFDNYKDPNPGGEFKTINVTRERPLKYRLAEDNFLEVGMHFMPDGAGKRKLVCLNQEWDEEGNRKIVDNGCPMCKIANESGDNRLSVSRFYALKVIIRAMSNNDFEEDTVKILEAKKTMFDVILKHAKDEDWGDPKRYDFKTKKEGKNLNTKYPTQASPKDIRDLNEEEKKKIEEFDVDLQEYYSPKSKKEIAKILNLDLGDGFSKEESEEKEDEDEEFDGLEDDFDF